MAYLVARVRDRLGDLGRVTSTGSQTRQRPDRGWLWIWVLAAVGVSLGPAAIGLIATEDDACVELYEETAGTGPGRFHAFDDRSSIPYIYTHCTVIRHGAPTVERSKINWTGLINGISFVLGVFFGSAGILGLVDRRRAALITVACIAICFAMVVIFFA